MILYTAARRRLAQAAPLAVLVPVLVALWALRDQLPTALPPNPPAPASDPVISGHPALLALRRSAPSASGSRPSCSDARPRAAPLGFIRVSRGAPKPLIGVSGAVRDRVVGERAPQPCAVLEVPPFLVEYDEAMSVHRVVQQSTQIADRPGRCSNASVGVFPVNSSKPVPSIRGSPWRVRVRSTAPPVRWGGGRSASSDGGATAAAPLRNS